MVVYLYPRNTSLIGRQYIHIYEHIYVYIYIHIHINNIYIYISLTHFRRWTIDKVSERKWGKFLAVNRLSRECRRNKKKKEEEERARGKERRVKLEISLTLIRLTARDKCFYASGYNVNLTCLKRIFPNSF